MGVFDKGNWKLCGGNEIGGGEKRRLSRKPDTYYLAYGSNLLPERIYGRCPDAVYAGKATLQGWRPLFKKSKTGCFLTIEQDANREVPCVVFKISEHDEALLDRFEGCPRYYYKRKLDVRVLYNSGRWSKKPRRCIVYVLHEDRRLGAPPQDYVRLLLNAYAHWGYDEHLIWTAIKDSIGNKEGSRYMRELLADIDCAVDCGID